MELGFGGDVATYYAKYRRGYPLAVVDAIADAFGLRDDDVVVDLGCGTGQLSLPLAERVRAVVGMDPEPDMLVLARRAAGERGVANVSWVLGADHDLPSLGRLVAKPVGALSIATAIHWMDRDTLFAAARSLLRPGGGIVVVTNGTPLWLQDADWPRTLRECLEQWLGRRLTSACQTDEDGRRHNARALSAAGYRVEESTVDYDATLTVDDVVGGVYSAMSADRLPPPHQRDQFAARIRDALGEWDELTEHVRVQLQFGHLA
jgi:ubiquinone/menaquinone biosynthesis C-methylase UbiE